MGRSCSTCCWNGCLSLLRFARFGDHVSLPSLWRWKQFQSWSVMVWYHTPYTVTVSRSRGLLDSSIWGADSRLIARSSAMSIFSPVYITLSGVFHVRFASHHCQQLMSTDREGISKLSGHANWLLDYWKALLSMFDVFLLQHFMAWKVELPKNNCNYRPIVFIFADRGIHALILFASAPPSCMSNTEVFESKHSPRTMQRREGHADQTPRCHAHSRT